MTAELTVAREPVRSGAEWERLADGVHASPFLRPGWMLCWWRAFGTGRLELLTVRRGEKGPLAALVPVRRHRRRLWSPTNWHSPEFGILTDHPQAGEVLCQALLTGPSRRVTQGFVDGALAALLHRTARSRGYRVLNRVHQQSPYLDVDGDWDGYERALGKKFRSELRRRRRRLEREGRLSFEVRSGDDGLEALLDEGFRTEAAGWKGAQRTAITSQAETRRFYSDVARWAAGQGWLRLAFLRLDRRAVAFDLCLELGGIHYLLKTGYDPAFRELGPGKLLRHDMLCRAFRLGLRRYEFLGSDAPWKREWSRSHHDRFLVQAFRPSPLGSLEWLAHAHGRPLAKRAGEQLQRIRDR